MRFFLRELVRVKSFTLSSLRRAVQVFVQSTVSNSPPVGLIKPSGLEITEMFDPQIFQSGGSLLDSSSYPLKVSQLALTHTLYCDVCRPTGSVHQSCYFHGMLRCVTHGWCPPIDSSAITPTRHFSDMSLQATRFPLSGKSEFDKMRTHAVVVPSTLTGIVSPVGMILKNSDKAKARILTGIIIHDDVSLAAANSCLHILGHSPIKARITNDLSASGINGASYTPPFRYPSLSDGIAIVDRNCWLAKGDITRYFYCFPLALCVLPLFLVRYFGKLFHFTRCPFGLSSCPYYCSAWGAEFSKWVKGAKIPCSHMMDDWLTRGTSREEALGNLASIKALLEPAGLTFDPSKDDCSQRLVFLGVLIDTVSMKLRFDPLQARVVCLLLNEALALLLDGSLSSFSKTDIRSIAGKLSWYSEALQSGRLHTHSWWKFFRFGAHLSSDSLAILIEDTEWWIKTTSRWGEGSENGFECPILSASELANNPDALYLLQSDASGPDGYGYIHGYLREEDPQFYSQQWTESEYFGSSHHGELQPLVHFLSNTSLSNVLLVWTTDSLAAMFSIDKGRCFEEISLPSLRIILELCDTKGILLVALWTPRELNQLTDYLSHLSVYLNRSSVEGRTSQLSLRSGSSSDSRGEAQQSETPQDVELRRILSSHPVGSISSDVRNPWEVRLSPRDQQQGVDKVLAGAHLCHKDRMSSSTETLPRPYRPSGAFEAHRSAYIQRPFGGAPQTSVTITTPCQHRTEARPFSRFKSSDSTGPLWWPRWLAAGWRIAVRDLGVRCTLGQWEKVFGPSDRQNQNSSVGRGDSSPLHRHRRDQLCISSSNLVRTPWSVQSTNEPHLSRPDSFEELGFLQVNGCSESPISNQENGCSHRVGSKTLFQPFSPGRGSDRSLCSPDPLLHYQEDGAVEV